MQAPLPHSVTPIPPPSSIHLGRGRRGHADSDRRRHGGPVSLAEAQCHRGDGAQRALNLSTSPCIVSTPSTTPHTHTTRTCQFDPRPSPTRPTHERAYRHDQELLSHLSSAPTCVSGLSEHPPPPPPHASRQRTHQLSRVWHHLGPPHEGGAHLRGRTARLCVCVCVCVCAWRVREGWSRTQGWLRGGRAARERHGKEVQTSVTGERDQQSEDRAAAVSETGSSTEGQGYSRPLGATPIGRRKSTA